MSLVKNVDVEFEGSNIPTSFEERKVHADGTIKYYGKTYILDNILCKEDRVYVGCSIKGNIFACTLILSHGIHLGEM